MNTDPASATGGRADYRVLMARTAGLGLLAASAVVFLIATNLTGVVVLGAGLAWLGVVVARRELRIRRRLADAAGARPGRSGLRAGPGEPPSAPPTPTRSDIHVPGSDRGAPHHRFVTSNVRGGTNP